MAAGMVGGALVTVLIELVIEYTKSAVICKRVCRKLQDELQLIRPDVYRIEQQMDQRRQSPCAEPLEVVERWLARLKEKLTEAEREVHRCNSGTKFSRLHMVENHDLTKKIQSLITDIRKLAGDDVSRATLSSTISNCSSHHSDGSSHGHCNGVPSPGFETQGSMHHRQRMQEDGSSHRHGSADRVSSPGFETQGSMLHRQRMEEISNILHAEDQTRHSMNPRRHSIASFDFSRPAEQPVVAPLVHSISSFDFSRSAVQPVAPVHYHVDRQQFVYMTPQAGHFQVPPAPQNFAHQGWFPSPSNGPYGHYGS